MSTCKDSTAVLTRAVSRMYKSPINQECDPQLEPMQTLNYNMQPPGGTTVKHGYDLSWQQIKQQIKSMVWGKDFFFLGSDSSCLPSLVFPVTFQGFAEIHREGQGVGVKRIAGQDTNT